MSGGGGSGSTTSTTMNYSPEEAARRSQVMAEAHRLYGLLAPQMSNAAYPGARPTGFDPTTIAAQRGLMNAAGAVVPGIQSLNDSINFSLRNVLYPESNPALQQTIQASIRPITESYLDPNGIMASIRSGAGNAGQFGGTRQGLAEGVAAGRYADALGDTAAKVSTAGYQAGLDAMGRAQAIAPQALQMYSMPSQWLGAVGAQREELASQQEQYNADSRMWGLNAPWLPLQNYANIVFGGASPGTTSQTSGGGPSTLGRLAGAGAMGLGAYGALGGAANPYALPLSALLGALGLFGG